MFGRIDHIGVAVDDLDEAISIYEGSFEMQLSHRETVESQGVEAALLDIGDGHADVIDPPEHGRGVYLAASGGSYR